MKSFLATNADHKKVKQKSIDLDVSIQEIIHLLIEDYLDQIKISKSSEVSEASISKEIESIF